MRPDASFDSAGTVQELEALSALIEGAYGMSLAMYRQGTIRRCLMQRMKVVGSTSIADYLDMLSINPEELGKLHDVLMIGVTDFFRDAEAFEALGSKVTALLNSSKETKIRVWIPACASGEEAYSVGMLLREVLPENRLFRIFATDISEKSLEIARAGLYPASIRDAVSPERLHRLLEVTDEGFQIRTALRQRMVVANHDILHEPPLHRTHTVCCRHM